jgi:hypothetical protein
MSDRSVIPVIDAVRAMLEPTLPAGSSSDNSASEPFIFEERTLYVYEDALEEHIAAGFQLEQTFEIVAVYVSASNPEEATQQRTRAITEELSSLRDAWFATIAEVRAREDELWSDMIGRAEHDLVRALEVRGFAVRFIGRRFITE